MILPTTHTVALLLAVLSLLCWGSWANTYKLAGRQRFELFYWDYALGVMLAAFIAAFTFGSLGFAGFEFLDDLMNASKHSWAYGLAAGAVCNLGGILMVAAMSLDGMSLALPVGLGLAVAVGLLLDYIGNPHANPALLLCAVVLILAAVVLDVADYRAVSLERAKAVIKTGKTKSTKVTASWKGILMAVIGGPLVALCFPLAEVSREPDLGMGPYAAAFMFAGGVFLSTFVYNLFFMNLPVQGEPLELLQYFRQPRKSHLLPLLGGLLWASGIVSYFVASSATGAGVLSAPPVPLLGPATAHVVGLGAALLSALWGLLVWKERSGAVGRSRALAALMLVLFAAALVLMLVAPVLTA